MEPGAGRRASFDARSRAGFGEIAQRILASDLRLSETERPRGTGGRRPDTEFLRPAPEKNYLRDARRERGKFRSFLLASLKHFLANEWDRARTRKRGGQ